MEKTAKDIIIILSVVLPIISIIIGIIIGFLIAKKVFTKQLQENPPINKNMIRAMYMQMGRKPSETQINSVVHAMKKFQK